MAEPVSPRREVATKGVRFVRDNNETLGEREAQGFVTSTFAAQLEEMHGSRWRTMTHAEATAVLLKRIESDRTPFVQPASHDLN